MRRVAVAAWILFLAPIPSVAQTQDPLFALWRWTPDTLGGRPGGLGGAYVAVADSAKAAYLNPAGVALIPQLEVNASVAPRWLSAAVPLGERVPLPPVDRERPLRVPKVQFGAAVYFGRTLNREFDLPAPRTLSSQADSGHLRATVEEFGVAVAMRPTGDLKRRVRVGAAARLVTLDLHGESRRGSDGAVAAVRLDGRHQGIAFSTGVLIDLIGTEAASATNLRVGASYHFKHHHDLARFEVDPTASTARASEVSLERPAAAALGLCLRLTDRWLMSVQVDETRTSTVLQRLAANDTRTTVAALRLPSQREYRAGVERSFDLSRGGLVRLRAGYHWQAPGLLYRDTSFPADLFGTRSDSDAPLGLGVDRNERRHRISAGVSLLALYSEKGVRIDVDFLPVTDLERLSGAVSVRF